MSGIGSSLTLLIDTHVLVWAMGESRRLTTRVREQLGKPGERLCVSAVTAWEYADLHRRGRIASEAEFGVVTHVLALVMLDTPADLWRLAASLPDIHRDPVDRMLIAHALHADLTLVTADRAMHQYPVRVLW